MLQGAPVTVCVLRGERERSRLALLSPVPAVPRCKAGGIWSRCPRLLVTRTWLLGGAWGSLLPVGAPGRVWAAAPRSGLGCGTQTTMGPLSALAWVPKAPFGAV